MSFPFYRLRGGGSHPFFDGEHQFYLDRVDGEEEHGEEGSGWGAYISSRFTELATVTSREAAMAVFRLHGVTEYQDWTETGAGRGWSNPMTPMETT